MPSRPVTRPLVRSYRTFSPLPKSFQLSAIGYQPFASIHLVTHFPVALKDGRPENRVHRLRDLDATLAVARAGGIDLWLHGHRHHPYVNEANPSVPFPCICAGSGTQLNCWTYPIYTIDETVLRMERRAYSPALGAYDRVTDGPVEWNPAKT